MVAKLIPRGVLITGASGQLGMELACANWPDELKPITLDRGALDLNDTTAIFDAVVRGHLGYPFAAVVNCAAFTAVDKAETDQSAAWRINALAPAAFASICATQSIPLVQISTDYVFPGDRAGPWEVNDPPQPINVYGASKLGGELAVRTSGVRYAIVRTAWVMSAHGNNFVKTMLRLAKERNSLNIVSDQCGAPTSAADLAEAISIISSKMARENTQPSGTFHFSNAGATNWADFATEIFRQSSLRGGPTAHVKPVRTSDYPTPARRPANSLLSHKAIFDTYGITSRPWQAALSDILDDLIGERIS